MLWAVQQPCVSVCVRSSLLYSQISDLFVPATSEISLLSVMVIGDFTTKGGIAKMSLSGGLGSAEITEVHSTAHSRNLHKWITAVYATIDII